MAISVIFTPNSMNTRQYDEVVKRLEDAGVSTPPGRLYHVCLKTGTGLRVIEVWESQEALNAFGQTLMPILQQVGVDPGQPEFAEVYNIIQG